MFSSDDLALKQEQFIINRNHFLLLKDFYEGKFNNFKDENFGFFIVSAVLAKFVSYKEEIWKKDKISKVITTDFSRKISDDLVFKGRFVNTKIGYTEEDKRYSYHYEPIHINSILEGKEHDSVWIIDNIRDSIAHGHYVMDSVSNGIIIKNNHKDRLLNCFIPTPTFFLFHEMINQERIGGYTDKKLTTQPLIKIQHDFSYPYLRNFKNEAELRSFFINNTFPFYSKVEECHEEDINKKYEDLTNFYNYNLKIREDIIKRKDQRLDFTNIYEKKISNYVKKNMTKYKVTVYKDKLNKEQIDKLIYLIREMNGFYERNFIEQKLLIDELVIGILCNDEQNVEMGISTMLELYSSTSLIKSHISNSTQKHNLRDLTFAKAHTFIESQKLANLYIFAVNTFVSNKETIYDNVLGDYSDFDISNFNYKDYSICEKLGKLKIENTSKLVAMNKNLESYKERLKKLSSNLEQAPDNKKDIINKNIEQIKTCINKTEDTIKDLVLLLDYLNKQISETMTDEKGKYLNNCNKSFFNHLRNSFAHCNIKYLDDRIIYNRKILLEDIDDNGNLTFRCECRYSNLVKLLTSDKFLNTLKPIDNDKNLSLKKENKN